MVHAVAARRLCGVAAAAVKGVDGDAFQFQSARGYPGRYPCAGKLRCAFELGAVNGTAAAVTGGRDGSTKSADVRGDETKSPIRWMHDRTGDQCRIGAAVCGAATAQQQ